MEDISNLLEVGLNFCFIILFVITRYRFNKLEKQYYELKTEYDYLNSKVESRCKLIQMSLEQTDKTLKAAGDTIGTLVELSNETTKWIQEISPEIRRLMR